MKVETDEKEDKLQNVQNKKKCHENQICVNVKFPYFKVNTGSSKYNKWFELDYRDNLGIRVKAQNNVVIF